MFLDENPAYPVDGALFYSPSTGSFYTVENLIPVLYNAGGGGWWDEDEMEGFYLTEDELNELLGDEYDRGRNAGRVAGYSEGLKMGRADGYAKGLTDGHRRVIANPASYKLIAAGNVPSGIVVSAKKGTAVTLSLAGKWSRFAASGVPKGWKFDKKKGLLTGKVGRPGKVKLKAYQGSSAAVLLHIEFKPTK